MIQPPNSSGPSGLANLIGRANRVLKVTSPGQADAVLASLGSFAVQLLVLRSFGADELGAFAFVYSGLVLAAVIPATVVFQPYELKAFDLVEADRLSVPRASMPSGFLVGGAASGLVALSALPSYGQVKLAFLVGLIATAVPATVISSVQDHVRRIAHIGGRSWVAASMSLTYFLTAVAGFVLLHDLRDQGWAPFGVVLVANLVGLILFFALRGSRTDMVAPIAYSELRRVGGWLLTGSVVAGVGAYAGNLVVERLAGLSSVGYIEAARIVGRPVQVVGLGLLAVLTPRIMTSTRGHDVETTRRWRWLYLGVLAAASAAVALLLTNPVVLRELSGAVPVAFTVPGLVLASVASAALSIIDVPLRVEMLAKHRQRDIARASFIGAVTLVIASYSAVQIGALAGPVSAAVGGTVSWIVLDWMVRHTRRASDALT